jgi:hypothetical protein
MLEDGKSRFWLKIRIKLDGVLEIILKFLFQVIFSTKKLCLEEEGVGSHLKVQKLVRGLF